MTYHDRFRILERRFRPLEESRVAAGLPFRYLEVRCDAPGCFVRPRRDTVGALALDTADWSLSENGGPDLCPSHAGGGAP